MAREIPHATVLRGRRFPRPSRRWSSDKLLISYHGPDVSRKGEEGGLWSTYEVSPHKLANLSVHFHASTGVRGHAWSRYLSFSLLSLSLHLDPTILELLSKLGSRLYLTASYVEGSSFLISVSLSLPFTLSLSLFLSLCNASLIRPRRSRSDYRCPTPLPHTSFSAGLLYHTVVAIRISDSGMYKKGHHYI